MDIYHSKTYKFSFDNSLIKAVWWMILTVNIPINCLL